MKLINPSSVKGTVKAQPSKSLMQRALAASYLSEGTSSILNPSFCDDSKAVINIIKNLGSYIDYLPSVNKQIGSMIKITSQKKIRNNILHCNESGLAMRMITPIAALSDTEIILNASGSLKSRPVTMMVEPLQALGAEITTHSGHPPVMVKGPLTGGNTSIDGSVSSQFLTGLLMALPLCPNNSILYVSNLKSRPYIKMTIKLLKHYGINIEYDNEMKEFHIKGNQKYIPEEYYVEGDWSGSSFIFAAGAIAGEVTVNGLSEDTEQSDKAIIDVLHNTGAKININETSVTVKKNDLKSFHFDATDCPDLFPPLVALACNCKGISMVKGVNRLKHKESNRGDVLLSEFTKIGAKININDDFMEIEGTLLQGGKIDSHGDHRIAMAGAIAGLNSEGGVKIDGWSCINKSYPQFFTDLESIIQ